MPDKKSFTKLKIIKLLAPSEVGAIFSVVISFVISLGVIFINRYRPGRLDLSFVGYSLRKTIGDSTLTGTLTDDRLIKDLPLICFGVILVILAILLSRDLHKLPSRKIKARKLVSQILVRLAAALILFFYLEIFFNVLLAYSVKISILSSTAGNVLGVVGYVILSVVISTIAIHINVLLLRLASYHARLLEI